MIMASIIVGIVAGMASFLAGLIAGQGLVLSFGFYVAGGMAGMLGAILIATLRYWAQERRADTLELAGAQG